MLIFTDKISLHQAVLDHKKNGATIGFVPTMGALHDGHLSLVNTALKENSIVVVSIFVNPTQFNSYSDLENYPRTPEKDLPLLKALGDKVWVFLPTVKDIYENQITSTSYSFDGLENQMEGKFRDGHFNGVGTVVSKLFEITVPDTAYFGEKDFQQLQIIRKLVEKEKIGTEIKSCPIHREPNGLAMSSRNQRLTDEEKENAAIIYQTLLWAQENFQNKSISELQDFVTERFLQEPTIELEYFEIADEQTLETITQKDIDKKYRAFIAVFIRDIRLIDNIALN